MSCGFVQNRECPYFPCHAGIEAENFNCLFCFCPLYALADQCGGNFCYTQEGIKDCSNCLRPHRKDSYEGICKQVGRVVELVKKPPEKS